MKVIVITGLIIVLLFGCTENNNLTPNSESNARYRLTFNATWSAQTHPNDFPSNPHFSGLIGITHNGNVSLFNAGQIATDGIKNMAELGSKDPLQDEIQNHISEGSGEVLISEGGVGTSPGDVSVEFNISSSHSFVTVVSMLAPSPDWFIAIEDINLYVNNEWITTPPIIVDIYDAGTDDGPTFLSEDDPSIPRIPIAEITTAPLAVNNVVAPLGSITITRIDN
ncbi:MAG: spondin domain-containing protein [Ignavibacteria bacterium]|jgi:hypothetical protein